MTIETEESIVLRGRQAQSPTLMWCSACHRQVEMVTPEQAAQIAGVTERTIYRWVEAGTVHFVEDCEHLLICASAISSHQGKRMRRSSEQDTNVE